MNQDLLNHGSTENSVSREATTVSERQDTPEHRHLVLHSTDQHADIIGLRAQEPANLKRNHAQFLHEYAGHYYPNVSTRGQSSMHLGDVHYHCSRHAPNIDSGCGETDFHLQANRRQDSEHTPCGDDSRQKKQFREDVAERSIGTGLSASQRQYYLESLQFDQIDSRHATIKTAHAQTCRWLLESPEYQQWLELERLPHHHGFLWIKGKPATGKSTIMKYALSHTKRRLPSAISISFFFNARGGELERTVLGMYRSLLFQLLNEVVDLQGVLSLLPPVDRGDHTSHISDAWNLETVRNLFEHAVARIQRRTLVCFIDALDECDEDEVREMVRFFEVLGSRAVSSQSRLHICFSSRHYPSITISKSVQFILEDQDGHRQDIEDYLKSELRAGRGKLIQEIKTEILQRASGIFLWVVLVVQILNKEYDRGRIHAMRKRLNEIPDGLDKLFDEILSRDGLYMEELVLCVQWLLFAKEPMKPEALYYAILAGVESDSLTAWDLEVMNREDVERFILNASKGLAEVTKTKAKTVQFIHESVRDFLLKGDGLKRMISNLGPEFSGTSHEQLKKCCLTYLDFTCTDYVSLATSPAELDQEDAIPLRQRATEKYPFAEYAVINVLYHSEIACKEGIPQDDFLKTFPLQKWVMLRNLLQRFKIRRYTPGLSLLYLLAESDLPNLIKSELKRVSCMDVKGERYHYPMNAALIKGNASAVRALLTPCSISEPEGEGSVIRSTLIPTQAFEAVLKDLLGNQSEPDFAKARTLLSWATNSKRVHLVKALLATDKIDVNCSIDEFDLTPLLWAVQGSCEGSDEVAEYLVATRKVDLNATDHYGRTALIAAAEKGVDRVVKLLIATKNVNLNATDHYGKTALIAAAEKGADRVVELLAATENVNLNATDDRGRTALIAAAEKGANRAVELLAATENVNLNATDDRGRTALIAAAENGADKVVELLITAVDTDLSVRDQDGRTALNLMAQNLEASLSNQAEWWYNPFVLHHRLDAQEAAKLVFELLLAISNHDQDEHDQNTKWLAEKGRAAAVVDLLLAKGEFHPYFTDLPHCPSLTNMAERGAAATIYLISQDNLDALKQHNNETQEDYQMQLMLLEQQNKKRLMLARQDMSKVELNIKHLLENETVNPDAKDNKGCSPLWYAATRNATRIVEMLLATGRVDLNAKAKDGRTPVFAAVEVGAVQVVRLLLATGKVDINTKANDGRTLLIAAVQSGRHSTDENAKKIVKLLLGGVDVNAHRGEHGNALLAALRTGDDQIVKMLLDCGAKVDLPSLNDCDGMREAVIGVLKDVVSRLLKANGSSHEVERYS
ncbi:hypothetical protein H2198_009044 [Neophaeococcomyces mojaviensis]|uniref:Uncharacterized protein n=1 Tax=Neophaeococcomyces mojaviensis TaxID=3383035 RepID=A0ACC2ZVK5_9EURO|nr:hypothetical protein H2198_009044 [Knufia sp. JES_112]